MSLSPGIVPGTREPQGPIPFKEKTHLLGSAKYGLQNRFGLQFAFIGHRRYKWLCVFLKGVSVRKEGEKEQQEKENM